MSEPCKGDMRSPERIAEYRRWREGNARVKVATKPWMTSYRNGWAATYEDGWVWLGGDDLASYMRRIHPVVAVRALELSGVLSSVYRNGGPTQIDDIDLRGIDTRPASALTADDVNWGEQDSIANVLRALAPIGDA